MTRWPSSSTTGSGMKITKRPTALRRCWSFADAHRRHCASWSAPWMATSVRTPLSIRIRSGKGCAATPSSSEYAAKPSHAAIASADSSRPTTRLTDEALAGLGHERRHLLPVTSIGVADVLLGIALLEAQGEKDVAAHAGREQQVTGSHRGRAPENQQPAQVERVAHDLIEVRCDERWLAQRTTEERAPALAQPEQLEMIDQECRPEQHDDAEAHDGPGERNAPRCACVPKRRRRDRPPLPHEQREHDTRDQHVEASLRLLRHGAGPYALEPGPGHHGMLQTKEQDQAEIHRHRDSRGTHIASEIDGSRHER